MSAFPLRPYLPADAPVLAAIFRDSIDELAREEYDEDQRAAWIEAGGDDEDFARKLGAQLTLVALDAGEPAGFISLKDNTHIDMIYVLPGFAREGVGSTLMNAALKIVAARGAKTISADVSDNAKPFFESFGFVAQQRNMVFCGDEVLGNTSMQKALDAAAPPAAAKGGKKS